MPARLRRGRSGGSIVRFTRNLPVLVATAVLALLALGSTGLSSAAHLSISGKIDANWRGAYDILAIPKQSNLVSSAASTRGVIEPDFLSYQGHGGISISQLDAIRHIPGVSVAAPISMVGYLQSEAISPDVYISKSALPTSIQFYRLTESEYTSDGHTTFLVATRTADVLLGPANLTATSPPPFLLSTSHLGWNDDGVDLVLGGPFPPQVTAVEAVDPSAEQQLLGTTSSFLSSLQIPQAETAIGTFDTQRIPNTFDLAQSELESIRQRTGGAVAGNGGGSSGPGLKSPVVPIEVASSLPYGLALSLEIDAIGPPLTHYPAGPQSTTGIGALEKANGSAVRPVGHVQLDLSSRLRAYEPPNVTLLWPGSLPPNGNAYSTTDASYSLQLAGRATYKPRLDTSSTSEPAFAIVPQGTVSYTGQTTADQGDQMVQSYRTFTALALPPAAGRPSTGGDGDPGLGLFIAPVGEFEFDQLALPSNPLNHVPLGAYEVPSASIADNVVLHPTAEPLGFLTSPPGAITNLQSAELLRGNAPIDAIRIRVDYTGKYTPSAIRKVTQIADQISAVGVDVQVVAGSSPSPVRVYVPKYFSSNKDLGWTVQEWTTLGAAQQTETGLSRGEQLLIVLVTAVGASLILAMVIADSSSKRDAIAALHALGWRKRRIGFWLVSDAVLAAVAILIATGVGWLVFGKGSLTSTLLGPALAAATLSGLAVSSVISVRRVARTPGAATAARVRKRQRARSPFRPAKSRVILSLRMSRQDWVETLCGMVALTGAAAGLALVISSVGSANRRAGRSLLAGAVEAKLQDVHFALAIVISAAGVVVALTTMVSVYHRRYRDHHSLAALGWSRARLLGLMRLERSLGVLAASVCALSLLFGVNGMEPGVVNEACAVVAIAALYMVASEAAAHRVMRISARLT